MVYSCAYGGLVALPAKTAEWPRRCPRPLQRLAARKTTRAVSTCFATRHFRPLEANFIGSRAGRRSRFFSRITSSGFVFAYPSNLQRRKSQLR